MFMPESWLPSNMSSKFIARQSCCIEAGNVRLVQLCIHVVAPDAPCATGANTETEKALNALKHWAYPLAQERTLGAEHERTIIDRGQVAKCKWVQIFELEIQDPTTGWTNYPRSLLVGVFRNCHHLSWTWHEVWKEAESVPLETKSTH